MLRSMYSGVSGMKAHQAKMDVIGNNIANVNTYGFKSSRTTFTEVYYQTIKSASGATSNRGGVNASQIGYGASVNAVDVMHTRTGFQMTDNGMDVAIAGEGFFQVQDPDGNIFYTRAGLFRIDPAGNLVDTNGNFVLGVSGDPFGKAASYDPIRIMVPSSSPVVPNAAETINGVTLKVQASNPTKDGNVSFNFMSDPTMAIGEKVKATLSATGIQISLNAIENFASIDELNNLVNQAILEANGNKEHPAGRFSFSVEPITAFPVGGLTGAEIASTKYTPNLGSIANLSNGLPISLTGFKISEIGNTFNMDTINNGPGTFQIQRGTYDAASGTFDDATPGDDFSITFSDGTNTYTRVLQSNVTEPGKIKLFGSSGDTSDYVTIEHPGVNALKTYAATPDTSKSPAGPITSGDLFTAAISVDANPSEASRALGFSSKAIVLKEGTKGGAQTVSDLTNIGIGADGVISAIHPQLGLISIGRIDLATFENPQGLIQQGNTYFAESPNSGKANLVNAGTDGSGALSSGSLEMSNVDLSKEFADMITTQRGFQASSRLITVSDEILNELVNLKR